MTEPADADEGPVGRAAPPTRRPTALVAAAAVAVAAVAVGVWWWHGPPVRPAPRSAEVTTFHDVEYHPTARLDVVRPAEAGSWPITVLLHGCCGGREDMFQLAHELASRGNVAVTAGWHTISTGGTSPEVYEQVACAVRFARARGHEYGGDVTDVTVVGWSDGALLGSAVAMSDDDAWQGDCEYTGSPRPDRFVGVAGFYGWSGSDDIAVDDGAIAFFGGTPSAVPEAWAAGNPFRLLGRHRSATMVLLVGDDDRLVPDARCFHAALVEAGHRAALEVLPDAGHLELIAPRTEAGGTVVDVIVAAAAPAIVVEHADAETACRSASTGNPDDG